MIYASAGFSSVTGPDYFPSHPHVRRHSMCQENTSGYMHLQSHDLSAEAMHGYGKEEVVTGGQGGKCDGTELFKLQT